MKKYVFIIITIGIILSTVFIYSTIKIQTKNVKQFQDSGYMLKSTYDGTRTQNIERYYFNANQNYKSKYNDKIVFNDANGDEVITESNNFIHYTNGSISSLTNGVILNLKQIEQQPILYYNIAAGKTLKKMGNNYTIQHLEKELQFTNLIWKISENKYLIVGNPIRLVFHDGTNKEIKGFVEIEYMDNEIIKIYNQEATYQTISSKVYLEMPDEIKINLGNKIVSQKGDNKMSLDNMVIDSDANIEIVDLDEYKEEETEKIENTLQEGNVTENTLSTQESRINELIDLTNTLVKANESTPNNETTTNNTQNSTNINNTQQIENGANGNQKPTDDNIDLDNNQENNNGQENTQKPNDDINLDHGDSDNDNQENGSNNEENKGDSEQEVVEKTTIKEPIFKIESFEVDSISLQAKITLQDEDELMVGDANIKIIKNDTGKIVYETQSGYGVVNIEVNVSSLSPDTQYTLALESTYKVEESEYTKNFIYKVFRTEFVGVDFEKDYFTNNKMAFKIDIDKDSQVLSADMVLMNDNQEVIQTRTIQKAELENNNVIEFTNLEANTQYVVKITNVLYNGQVITNGFELSKKFKTLKDKPTLGNVEFEIDKRNSCFKLRLKSLTDPDKGVINYRYEIYDTRKELTPENVVSITTLKQYEDIQVSVDERNLQRGVPYTFKIVAEFNDNEKIVEYESSYSNVMILDGVKFPTVTFQENEVTFERIKGNLIIEDNSNTINLDNSNKFIITYTDSVGMKKTFTSQGSLVIPVDVNNLRANETYKFEIFTRVNLQDGNDPIDECYIGGAIVQTKTPNELVAKLKYNKEEATKPFNVSFKLGTKEGITDTLELDTLSGMTVSIYAGQSMSGNPIRTIRVIDKNTEPYISQLKEDYYNKETSITPEFFGAKNTDFRDKYYTIVVSEGYDYTQYPNKIPIVNNTITVETNGYMPDLPTDPDNAIEVTPIRNRDKEQKVELDPSTIVGYSIKAGYDNSQLLAKRIIYKVHDANTGKIIDQQEFEFDQNGTVPTCEFVVLEGTNLLEDNDALRRGNSYYFTYEVYVDLNNDGIAETKYPYEVEGEQVILKSKTQTPVKQEARFIMYPSISTNSAITYQYQFTDIDCTLEKNEMQAINSKMVRDIKPITQTEEEQFNTITFENILPGDLRLSIARKLEKNQVATLRDIVEHSFEGKVDISEIRYHVEVDSNRVVITLLDENKKMNRIGAINVEFITAKKTIKKEFLIPDNNIITIGLNEIGELMNQSIEVKVYVAYDTGIIGFDTDSEYVAWEKAHSTAEMKYYYALNEKQNLVERTSLINNIYNSVRDKNSVLLTRIKTKEEVPIKLEYTQSGFRYGDSIILQKQIEKVALSSSESTMIHFDKIIPGISMQEGEDLNLMADLSSVEFQAKLSNTNNIKNNEIEIEIYQTDENFKGEKLVKTVTKTVSDFNHKIEIEGLEPKSYYYMQFKTNITKQNGTQEQVELYDVDRQVLGRHYYFSTLADVGITDVKISYNPVSYQEKTLDISYHLEKVLGYQKIEYKIYQYRKETNTYELIMENLEDTLFKRDMVKQIDINPQSKFVFGQKYKIEIIPLAIYLDLEGNEKRVEVGKKEMIITAQTLQEPTIGIKAERAEENGRKELRFKVTVYDQKKVVENDKYRIRIKNDRQEDITPNEYRDKEFSTSIVNNTIILENADEYRNYTIEIMMTVDLENDATDLVEYEKKYIAKGVNENGISLGDITLAPNNNDGEKINLIFNNSYKLLEVDKLRYSIYNTNGYSTNGTVDFIPMQTISNGEVYYVFTLNENLARTGNYQIELQFLKEDKIIGVKSLDYTYIE